MKRVLLVLACFALPMLAFAQKEISQLGCATVTSQKELQEVYDYVQHATASKTTATVDSIPLSIHIVGKDDGTGYYRPDYLLQVLCKLNAHYAPVGFYFYVRFPIEYINNSSYYEHDFWGGDAMMGAYEVANTANIYFVMDPAGACGYFSYGGDAIAIKMDCAAPNSTTLVHELGHYFGLPHTFSGWENGAVPSNPEKVTRGAGANCSNTGDGFCDTDADFIGSRWQCPYTGVKYDVNGDKYHPDSSLYMCYSSDGCMSRFSQQQIGRMQSRLYNQRSYLLSNGKPPAYTALAAPKLVYPTDSLHANFKTVVWNKVANAEAYYVRVSEKISSFTMNEMIVYDTMAKLTFTPIENAKYKVTVSALSGVNLCRTTKAEKEVVYTLNSTPLILEHFANAAGAGVKIYPNPAVNELNISLTHQPEGVYTINVVNISGQVVRQAAINHKNGSSINSVSLSGIPGGIYIVRINGNNAQWIEKLHVAH